MDENMITKRVKLNAAPELKELEDYCAEVRATAHETTGDFIEEIPLAFTTQTLISQNPTDQLMEAVKHHIQAGTFTCKHLENWSTTAL